MDYEVAVKNIRKELKTYILNNDIQSLVMGMSGGIDSTLCAILAKPVCDELNIPLIGRSIPASSNSEGENSRAQEVGELFCTDFGETEIQWPFHQMARLVSEEDHDDKVFSDERAIQNGNIKARLRMIYLYDLASVNKGLVLSTDNWTEYLLGFWTLHGDVGDYGMIQELWKTEVYEMAHWLVNNELKFVEQEEVQKVIDADATDGLGISKTDLEQILPNWEGSSKDGYREVDNRLKGWDMLLTRAAKTPKVINAMTEMADKPVIERHIRTGFKRTNPINIPRNKIIKNED